MLQAHFWMRAALEGHTTLLLLAAVIAAAMSARNSGLAFASGIVATPGTSAATGSVSALPPGASPVAPFALSVTSAVMNFFLSPTIITFEIAVQFLLTS